MSSAQIDTLSARFHALFAPGETGHGYYTLIGDGVREDCTTEGKLDNAVKGFAKMPVTPELWAQHLLGKRGIGIVPIRKDGTVRFGAIDVDQYGIDIVELANKILTLQLPLIPCRSKSGGAHCYMFTSEPVSAFAMQTRLRDIAAMLGHGGVEIFPKQTKLAEQDEGSWINCPFFNGDNGTRYAVRPDGERLTMEQFLARAEQVAVSAEFFRAKAAKAAEAFPDGPPCLNHLAVQGFPTMWNNTLFNIALYYRKSLPTGWERAVDKCNASIQHPLLNAEVAQLVKSVGGKKEYAYQCKSEPLASHCDRAKCQSRKFGISTGGTSFPVLEELRKLDIDPPVYFWDVIIDGEPMTLELTDAQVQDPREFKKRVWQKAGLQIPLVKKEVWDSALNSLRREDRFKVISVPKDGTTVGQAWELIETFCTRNEGSKDDLLRSGRPYTEDGRTYFRLSDLMRFLASQQFKEYKTEQLAKVLKDNKDCGYHKNVKIKGRVVNLWSLPEFAKQTSSFDVPDVTGETPF